ncbi:uncharacterized protein LOC144451154 isoform X2 [Glandiceps talaboti]
MATDSISPCSPDNNNDDAPLSALRKEIKREPSVEDEGIGSNQEVGGNEKNSVDRYNDDDDDDDDEDDDDDDDDDEMDEEHDRTQTMSKGMEHVRRSSINDDYSRNSSEDYSVEPSEHPFRSSDDFRPTVDDDGQAALEIECGENKALLYLSKLCQGSKGQCVFFKNAWLTPNEFQFVSGRETAKDWKRSIRHRGKCLKTLMNRGLLQTHPPICDCAACRVSTPVNRGRLADKRISSAPTMVPNKRSSSSHNDYGGMPISRDVGGPQVMVERSRKSFDSSNGSLSAIISHLHQTSGSQFSDRNERSSPTETEFNRKRQYSTDRESGGNAEKRRHTCSPQTDEDNIQVREGDDFAFEEQRRIYELANSLEPQHIEHAQRSVQGGNPLSPSGSDRLSPSNIQQHQSTILSKQLHKPRKQTMPQHHEPETNRGPTITLTYGSSKSTFPINRQHSYNGSRYTELTAPSSHHDRSGSTNRNGMYIELKSRHDMLFNRGGSHGNPMRSASESATMNSGSTSLDNLTNWTVDDVYQFVSSLGGCAEYASIFREQGIDGETLPLLTEEHLLQNFGLKLGPALKIRLHVARRQGYCIYCRGSKLYDEMNQM